MDNTSLTPQQSSFTMENSAKILQDTPSMAQSFLWELCYDVTEFEDALPLTEPKKLRLHPQMRDVMLAEISMLGHADKYPRSYDWQQLIQGLSGNEELLWIITKKKTTGENENAADGLFSVYLGLKFNQEQLRTEDLKLRQRRFQVFCDNFAKRRFPESSIDNLEQSAGASGYGAGSVQKIIERLAIRGEGGRSVYAVVGMPSLKDMDPEKIIADRNEDSRPYASLNDLLEPYVNEKGAFTVIFSVKPCSEGDVQTAFQEKFRLKDLIKPYCEQEINRTEGKSWGTGVNITPKHETENRSSTKKVSFFYGMMRAIVGTHKKHCLAKKWQDLDITTSTTVNEEQRSTSSHEDQNTSTGQTLHITHSDMVYLDSVLEQSLKQLQQAAGGNGFYTNAMIYADDRALGCSLARTLRAALSGSQNYMRPMQIIPIEQECCPGGFFQLDYNMSIADIMRQSSVRQEVMNSEKASFSLLVPDSDIPGGMTVKKSVFYAKPEETEKILTGEDNMQEYTAKEPVELGKIAYYQDQLGYNNEENKKYRIKHKDIFSHMFIMGAPGGGKSERATYILKHLPTDIRLIVLETAKKEYGDKLSRPGKKLIRYTLGNSAVYPLRLNPFYFDEGMNIKQHISALTDALADLLPMEALIGPKIRSAIESCYTKCCWDVENGRYCGESLNPVYPDMLLFNCEMQHVCDSLSDYGAEVKGNYTGALKNRASIFLDAVYRDIFAFDGNKTIEELFPEDSDVVIEMEDMPPSEINMPAFIITILMHRLRAYRFKKVAEDRMLPEDQRNKNKFIIAIEEAHNVLSREIESSGGDERQSGKGKSLLQLVKKTLAEGRGIGLGMIVIDQAAHAVAQSVLADTNIKIVFGQRDGEEIETIGKSIGLAEEDWKDLQYLANGECIISTIDNPQPFKLSKLTDIEIEENQRGSSDIQKMDETLLYPRYFEGKRLLENLYKDELLSVSGAKHHTRYLLETLCRCRCDLARHIVGKFILDAAAKNPRYYKLLEEFLQRDCAADKTQTAINIAAALLALQPATAADHLLTFLKGKRGSLEKIAALPVDLVFVAIQKVRLVLGKDLLKEDDKRALNDAFDELRSFFEVRIAENTVKSNCDAAERNEKLKEWRHRFWKNIIFSSAAASHLEHLKYNEYGD